MEKSEKITPKQREKIGRNAGIFGIICNIFLAAGKMIVGALTGALSVFADGLNNLSDCGSSIISVVSFRMSAKPADKEHPYGHERIEYVSSLVVSFIILMLSVELCKESVTKMIHPEETQFSALTVAVLLVSVLVKLVMFSLNRTLAKRIDSEMLKATATDSISDCIATIAVLIALVVSHFSGVELDGIMGVGVALFIARSGIGILKENVSKLVGQAPAPQLLDEIKKRILAHKEVLGIHDLNVYSYGPDKYFASVHIELDAAVDVVTSHEIVDCIEREFAENTTIALTGHLDPVAVGDPLVEELKERVKKIVGELSEEFTVHDFRIVKAENFTNVIFEVAVPFDCKLSEDQIKAYLGKRIRLLSGGNYYPVIVVEKSL